LGGPQAGLIVGRRDLVEACRRHPLARALRVGKLTLAALQATLAAYLRGEAEQMVPVWRMCATTAAAIGARAQTVLSQLTAAYSGSLPVEVAVIPGESAVGGGSLPGETLPTMLLAIAGCGEHSPTRLSQRLRTGQPPLLARIEGDRLLLDLRTIAPEDDTLVAAALVAALSSE